MNKKLLTLAIITPLIYTACNSNTVASENVTKTEPAIQAVSAKVDTPIIKEVATVSNNAKVTTVSFVDNKPLIKEEGLLHIEGFMGTLKPTLMDLMKMDKTHVTAMGGCSSMAMNMTNDYSKLDPKVNIRRTALKYRNPSNIPDNTDTVVMEKFLASKNFKEPLIVEMPDHYRVYKALDMQQACMACHGDIETMSPKLVKMIDKLYPKDLATGLKLGEFRGTVIAELKK